MYTYVLPPLLNPDGCTTLIMRPTATPSPTRPIACGHTEVTVTTVIVATLSYYCYN